MAQFSPIIGGIVMLASVVGSVALYGFVLSTVLGWLSLLSMIAVAVGGVSALLSAFGRQPEVQTLPAA